MEQERRLGRLCMTWARIEDAMQEILWILLNVPLEDGRVMTAGADANRKLQWLGGFANKHLTGEELQSLKTILARIDEVRQDRNFAVHGSWGTIEPEGIPICFSVKEKSPDPTRVMAESFPRERMMQITRETNECRIALMEWANDHSRATGRDVPYPPGPYPTRK
jgi:hypothetical protein